MKNFKSKNLLFIVLLILSCLFAFSSVTVAVRMNNSRIDLLKENNENIEKCKKIENDSENYEWCREILNEKNLYLYDSLDPFELKEQVSFYIFYGFNSFLFIFVIIIGSCYYVTHYLKNSIIHLSNNRVKYSNIRKELFISSWKFSVIVPVVFIICYLIVCLYSKSLIISSVVMDSSLLYEYGLGNNILVYFFKDIFNAFMLGLVYTSICLIIARKEHNYILAVIKSFIVIIGIELLIEVFINQLLLFGIFNVDSGMILSIIDIREMTLSYGFWPKLITLVVEVIISFILVFISYRNKETLVIDCEKNNEKEK